MLLPQEAALYHKSLAAAPEPPARGKPPVDRTVAISVVAVNATTLTVTAAAGSVGMASVTVATPSGRQRGSHVTPAPTVTITGTEQTVATAVTFSVLVQHRNFWVFVLVRASGEVWDA
jgi:hypothetical protein